MKYKLLQDLPFLVAGRVFEQGSWVGGGWCVDLGEDRNGSHNGVQVFKDFENALLDSILEKKNWIEWIPDNKSETLKWKDTTTYSRGQVERHPTTFSIKKGNLKITITCGHIHYKGVWIMHCRTLGMEEVELVGCETVKNAKSTAITLVKNKLSYLQKMVNSLGT